MKTRRTLALSAALCAVLAGCGQNETTTTGSTSPTTPAAVTTTAPTTTAEATPTEPTEAAEETGAGATPGGTATPTETSTPRTNAATTGAASVPQTDPGEYGDAAVAAWTSGNRSELTKYASSSAISSLGSVPQGDLLRTACEGDMCSYTTENGERVTLTFDLDAVRAGQGGGIIGAKVD